MLGNTKSGKVQAWLRNRTVSHNISPNKKIDRRRRHPGKTTSRFNHPQQHSFDSNEFVPQEKMTSPGVPYGFTIKDGSASEVSDIPKEKHSRPLCSCFVDNEILRKIVLWILILLSVAAFIHAATWEKEDVTGKKAGH